MLNKEIPFSRILFVDDSEADFFIANSLLKRRKPSLSVYYAMDVESGLNMLKAFKPGECPDLILLDWSFDGQKKQGVDFLKEFFELYPANTNRPKLIVLSAYLGFNDAEAITKDFLEVEIIEKPFTPEKLVACISYSFSGLIVRDSIS